MLDDTSPLAAVEFDAHADGSRVAAVRHDADATRNDRRTNFADLGDVRVAVAVENLRRQTDLVNSWRTVPRNQ